MNNEQIKNLCLQLMSIDNEDEIIELLKKVGLWDNPKIWRLYGDTPDNYSAAGNQANDAESALVEKVTNSRDARLMLQCLLMGIDPKGIDSPQSVKAGIGKFFDIAPNTDVQGEISELDNTSRTKLAKGMTIALTGESPGLEKRDVYPCITICDDGEGQTPDEIPETILSLNKSIKSEIKFTHGKFNMGGTAVLTFCGEKNLQLIVSKRHPELLKKSVSKPSERDCQWGFTIVKREFPEGNRTKSWYKYLAPIDNPVDIDKPGILSFSSDNLPIFPEKNEAYVRESEWGTLIKLYNYQTKARGHALRDSGLLRSLDVLLPDMGLPMRMHECRKSFRGHSGSFDNNLTGLQNRLSDDNANLELKKPLSEKITIDGQTFEMLIYVLKSKEATSTYRKSDKAVIFTLNGQAQGWFHERFFERAKMGYLRDSLIVIVDCSKIDYTATEQLFQNSRDRLSTKPIRNKLEAEIEDSIKDNSILRELREQRRREKTAEKLNDSKPLEDILKSVIKNNLTLSNLFLVGNKAISTFKPKNIEPIENKFEGKRFPTYFKFKKIEYNKILEKHCHINQRCRIPYETDAVNDYLKRSVSPGDFQLYVIENGKEKAFDNYKINLNNGIASLSIHLPKNCEVGDAIQLVSKLSDVNHLYEPFVNAFNIHVLAESNDENEHPPRPPKNKSGGITLPENIQEVAKNPTENQIAWTEAPKVFDENTGIAVLNNGLSDNQFNANGYDWYINVDNKYLVQELKSNPEEADILKAQFMYSQIIIGISMLYTQSLEKVKDQENHIENISFEDRLYEFSKSISPVLIPVINELSKMRDNQVVIL